LRLVSLCSAKVFGPTLDVDPRRCKRKARPIPSRQPVDSLD
jgi:hypothetical protein